MEPHNTTEPFARKSEKGSLRPSPLTYLLDKLQAHKSGKEWIARCPAHEDHTPSLAITEENGKILLYDHGGQCTTEAICAAIGITTRDLSTADKSRSSIAATYDYTDEAGTVLFQVVRYEPKTFKQRRGDRDVTGRNSKGYRRHWRHGDNSVGPEAAG